MKKLQTLNEYEKVAYKYDASPFIGKVREVIIAKSEKDVINAVKLARKYRIDIVARGGGTSVVGGVIPNYSLVIDLSRLKKIKIDKKNKIATVDAGVTISELNKEAKKYGLWLPVIPASHEVATIGGAIATNASGIRAIKYGKMEKWVKEIKVVDGNGRIRNLNGKEVKDFCGSEGIFGIIISTKILLTELPKFYSLSIYEFDDLKECVNFSFDIEKNKNVSAIEFLGKKCSKLIFGKEKYCLIVEFESLEGENREKEEISQIWRKREGLYSLLCNEGYIYAEDPMIKEKEKMIEFIKWCEQEGFPVFGHIGARILHVHFSEERKNRRHEMWRFAKELGAIVGEHGIGIDKKLILTDEEKEEIRKKKEKYDPLWIFNNGKVIDKVELYE